MRIQNSGIGRTIFAMRYSEFCGAVFTRTQKSGSIAAARKIMRPTYAGDGASGGNAPRSDDEGGASCFGALGTLGALGVAGIGV